MKISSICAVVLLIGLFSATVLHAQDSASVTGTVRDSSGASVANAQVMVSAADRGINRETTTNGDGDYSVAALPPGSYDVTVNAQGLKKYEEKVAQTEHRLLQKLARKYNLVLQPKAA